MVVAGDGGQDGCESPTALCARSTCITTESVGELGCATDMCSTLGEGTGSGAGAADGLGRALAPTGLPDRLRSLLAAGSCLGLARDAG